MLVSTRTILIVVTVFQDRKPTAYSNYTNTIECYPIASGRITSPHSIEITDPMLSNLLKIVAGVYNELTATAVAIVWFEWGTATQSNGESLVKI